MKYIILAFSLFLLAIEIAFPVGAIITPPIDEVEVMLKKVEKNLKQASAVVSIAKAKNEAMVEEKIEEKAELKEAVVEAEKKIEVMQQVNEVYAAKMISVGLDTAIQEIKYSGPVYDAWLNYVEEGGKEDFEYFRLYIWQPK